MTDRAVRTSTTHPLRVDWVEMPAGRHVGITIAPGKHTISGEGFRWERSLDRDLDRLVAVGVQTLVCLLEEDEMRRLEIPDLVETATARGLDVLHCPIVDVSVPTLPQARDLIRDLRAREDESIVVHCNGGLGRSGVIVGCLLRALGLSAKEAQKRLVDARGPRCPETAAQRAFIAAFDVEDAANHE